MKIILNVTQHPATKEQEENGVIDAPRKYQEELKSLLTFAEIPSQVDLQVRASKLQIMILKIEQDQDLKFDAVMIGGAPFFMHTLHKSLSKNWKVVYAFSQRTTITEKSEDGSVTKVNVFKHVGFVTQ